MDDDEPTSRYRSRIYEWFRARYELAPVFATGFCARVSVLQLWLSGADCFALSAAGAGQAGEDGCRSSSARIAYKERVFSVQNDAFHLPFTDVVIDWYCAIGTEDVHIVADIFILPYLVCLLDQRLWEKPVCSLLLHELAD
jgi:hypothetical protein